MCRPSVPSCASVAVVLLSLSVRYAVRHVVVVSVRPSAPSPSSFYVRPSRRPSRRRLSPVRPLSVTTFVPTSVPSSSILSASVPPSIQLSLALCPSVPSSVRHRPSRQRRVAYILVDAASGLSHLHNLPVRAFHRDIKGPNILLDKNGTAKMADFGLSCVSQTSQFKVCLCYVV